MPSYCIGGIMDQFKLITLALLATFFWGLSDTCFKRSTKPDDKYSHFRILFVIGLFMGLQAIFELYKLYQAGNTFSLKTIWIYIPISFLYILSMGVDFYGYRYLRISVGSPIASTSGAMAGILSWLVLKNEMTPLKFFAIMLIFFGLIAMAYLEHQDQKEGKLGKNEIVKLGATALIFPITYALVDAVATFLDEHYMTSLMTAEEALISFELTFFIVGIISIIYIKLFKKDREKIINVPLTLGGLTETAGQFFYVYALSGDGVVTAPIMSLDGVFASILGVMLLKEKLNKKQYLTIFIIGVGVFLLGFFE